jgi:methyl-accepting chemotaxis protein
VPEHISSSSLSKKLAFLVGGVWLFIAFFAYIFVNFIFTLTPEQSVNFSLIWWLGVLVTCGLSLWMTYLKIKPLLLVANSLQDVEKNTENQIDDAANLARSLYLKTGLIGFIGPIALLSITAIFLHYSADLLASDIWYFVVLGLFCSFISAAALLIIPQKLLSELQAVVAKASRAIHGDRVVSLKLKLTVLSFSLGLVPTLLVGSMSFFTANRLLGQEMGDNLAKKLSHMNKGIGPLIESGLAKKEIEDYLSDEAAKLERASYIVYGKSDGRFYGSDRAPIVGGEGKLKGELAQVLENQIIKRKGVVKQGTVLDPVTELVFAYSFSEDVSWVSFAPIKSGILGRATEKLLWLIVAITICSMFVAVIVGYFFASNMGDIFKRMAGVTEEVAKGELVQEVSVISDDEIGVLGSSLQTMIDNLRRMFKDVAGLSQQIASTCNQLLVKASAISTGAEVQSQSVQGTSESVEELNSNIQSASDNLQALAHSSRETAEAAKKIGESFNVMLGETNGLQKYVEQTGNIVSLMVSSVTEVAGSIRELSQGAERSALSMAEMDRSISEVSSSAADTAQIARKSIEVARNGEAAVSRTIDGMDRIVNSNREASRVIMGLGNRIEEIGSILGVIDEIADQTNLLALNAAIIAAQAGEHGRGFAVVADEIRSLAERTGSSTREISQMITDVQDTSEEAIKVMKGGSNTVNEGVSLAKQAGDALGQILVSFEKAAENVESIAGYTEGQARSSMTVAREIAHVAEMAGRISEAAASQSSSGDELQSAFQDTLRTSQSLSKIVSQQSQENRQAIAAVAEMNESTTRVNMALLDQSKVSDGILQTIEQIREIARNHAEAALEMGEATKLLAEKSDTLKTEISEFHV